MRLLPILLALVACTQPGPDFRGAEATRIQAPKMTFTIRLKDGRAQAIRTGFVPVRHLARVYVYGALAMEQASGCQVIDKSFRGDPAVMTARLDCDDVVVDQVICQVDRMPGGSENDLVAACDKADGRRSVVIFKG